MILYYNESMNNNSDWHIQDPRRQESAFGEGYSEGASFGYEGGRPGGLEFRLYSSLMASGRYADLDKAKHNEQYRNYLLSNLDDDCF